jgi:hypothetical protein
MPRPEGVGSAGCLFASRWSIVKKKVNGTCRLCLRIRPLLNSHVLPEFLYKDIYDPMHRFKSVPAPSSEKKPRLEQKGLTEPLLCSDCERRLSVYETYSAPVVRDMKASAVPKVRQTEPSINDATVIPGVDYSKFKLFLMSLVWRAGVASGDFWEAVKLGPHDEKLRSRIYAGDPGKTHEYGCMIVRRDDVPQPFRTALVSPTRVRSAGGHICYFFVFNGMGWRFYVSSHTSQLPVDQPFLAPAGDLQIFPDFDGFLRAWTNNALKMAQEQKRLHP